MGWELNSHSQNEIFILLRPVTYIVLDKQMTSAPHAIKVFYVGRWPCHYRLLKFWSPETRTFLITGTYRIYPTCCSMPTISEGDCTIIAAMELMNARWKIVTDTCTAKRDHAKVLNEITEILSNGRPPRVEGTENTVPQILSPLRVSQEPTQSHDTTTPTTLCKNKYVYQRHTRSNTPIPMPSTLPQIIK